MAEPAITIDFSEFEGSPTEQNGPQGFQATRILRCAWADRLTLHDQLLGTFDDGMGGSTTDLPHLYPHRDGVRCVSIPNIVGHDDDCPLPDGADTTVATYQYALVTATYAESQLGPGAGGGSVELTDETIEPWAEWTTYPPKGLKWGSTTGDSLTDDEAIGRLFKGFNWVYTRMNVASVPSAYASLVGKVNNGSITSSRLGFTFAAETLLYEPPLLTRKVNPDGVSSKWTITTRFKYRPATWNKYWRPSANDYVAIYDSGGQVKPYTPADFSPLIS